MPCSRNEPARSLELQFWLFFYVVCSYLQVVQVPYFLQTEMGFESAVKWYSFVGERPKVNISTQHCDREPNVPILHGSSPYGRTVM